jgi:hypothetical protein
MDIQEIIAPGCMDSFSFPKVKSLFQKESAKIGSGTGRHQAVFYRAAHKNTKT